MTELEPYVAIDQRKTPDELVRVDITDEAGMRELFLSPQSASGVSVNRQTAYSLAPWYAGIDWIASTCARCKPHVFKRTPNGGKIKAEDHPAYWLLQKRWNPSQPSFKCIRQLVSDSIWAGNGYASIFRNPNGVPLEMYNLDPQVTYPIVYRDAIDLRIVDIKYQTSWGGRMMILNASDVIHVQGALGNYDNIVGLRLVEVLKDVLGLGIATQKFASHFFESNATIGLVIEIPAWLDKEKAQELKDRINENHRGSLNAFKTWLAMGGSKISRLAISAEESQWIEAQQFNAVQIAVILGIWAGRLGVKEAYSYNSLEQQRQDELDSCIDKHFVGLEGEFETKLLTEFQKDRDTHEILFDRDKLLSSDAERMTAANLRADYLAGIRTKNEVRHLQNVESIGPDGDEFLIPTSVTIEGDDPEPIDNDLAIAPAPPVDPTDTNPTQIEVYPSSMDRSAERLEQLTNSTIARLITRLRKSVKTSEDLGEHKEVIRSSLEAFGDTGRAVVDKWLDGLGGELASVLPEQAPAVFDRIDVSKLVKELAK